MKSQPAFYLELILRSPEFIGQPAYKHNGRNDDSILHVPVYYTWQEGPDDLHVFFDKDTDEDRVPFIPEFDSGGSGDYIVPDPKNSKGLVRAYHIGFRSSGDPKKIVPESYVNRLKVIWSSPCDSRDKKHPTLVAFLKKTQTLP